MATTKPTTPAAAVAIQQSDNVAHALAGAGGGLLSMALTYPLITLSTRAQVESKRADTTTLDAVRHILAREGVSGLYAGIDSLPIGTLYQQQVEYALGSDCTGKTVLDLGGGLGLHARKAVDRGAAFVDNVDVSANMLATGKAIDVKTDGPGPRRSVR